MAIRSTFTTGEVLTAADLTDTIKGAFINTETTTARTLGTADAGNLVTLNNNSGGTVTIPTNTTWGAPLGTLVHLINIGTAGTFTAGTAAGVTLNAASATLAIQEAGTLIKTALNTWQFVKQSPPPGLAFITGTTFATSSAVNVNNCFTSTYDNYRIIVNLTAVSANDVNIAYYYRAGGVDTTTNYYRGGYSTDGATLSNMGASNANLLISSTTYATNSALVLDSIRPQAAEVTRGMFTSTFTTNAGVGPQTLSGQFRQNSATAFDGFSLVPASGTISGTLRVYGYRNS